MLDETALCGTVTSLWSRRGELVPGWRFGPFVGGWLVLFVCLFSFCFVCLDFFFFFSFLLICIHLSVYVFIFH